MSIAAGSGELETIQHDWDISLTQRGIRIDTNIASIPDLYKILLKGVSKLRIGHESTLSHSNFPPKSRGNFDPDSPASSPSSSADSDAESAVVVRNYPFWKPPTLSFPLYNPWESEFNMPPGPEEQLPQELIDSLVDCFLACILVLQLPDKQDFMTQYRNKTLDPLVLNASLSWAARHAAIYHNMFPGKDPNVVGEQFFTRAKQLLRDRVFLSKPTTIHALLIMYLYQVGKMGPMRHETQSEAYLYLGMANRMILDQKMHHPKPELDIVTQELFRRFFWVGYFLELLASAHMDKPSVIPEREVIHIPGCQPLAHEDEEAQLKVEFSFHRHRLALIYRDISLNLTREEPLLSAVSILDRRLKAWYNELPNYFRWQFNSQRDFRTRSFREQGCLKLVTDYHFCHLQLYRPFLAKPREPPSTIAILSHDICVKSATTISRILVFYTHLKAQWCHFTVDSFVLACLVHQHIFLGDDSRLAEASRLWLINTAGLLRRSPVSHHKAVMSFVQSLEEFLIENGMPAHELLKLETKPDLVDQLKHDWDEDDGENTEIKTDYSDMFGGSVKEGTPLTTSSWANSTPALFPVTASPPQPVPQQPHLTTQHQAMLMSTNMGMREGVVPLVNVGGTGPMHTSTELPSFASQNFEVGSSGLAQQQAPNSFLQFSDFLYTPLLDLGLDPAAESLSLDGTESSSGTSPDSRSSSLLSAPSAEYRQPRRQMSHQQQSLLQRRNNPWNLGSPYNIATTQAQDAGTQQQHQEGIFTGFPGQQNNQEHIPTSQGNYQGSPESYYL